MAVRLPDRIGRYRVQSLIGQGGFGYVVRAYDAALDDSVAIKVLAENWAADEDIRRRFVEEARLLRRIRSADLVTVHDIGETEDNRPFFVMTFAERGTLAERLAGRRNTGLDPDSARKLLDTLGRGLGALHASGIVHRDINPRNILIRPLHVHPDVAERRAAATQVRPGLLASDERLLLGDLGLAKDFVRSGVAGASVVGGTPFYMAPEQLDASADVGPRTDIFSATAVMWETITGSRPPDAGDLASALSVVDDRWREFFATGLAADPNDRFADIDAWLAAGALLLDGVDTDMGRAVASVSEFRSVTNPYKGLAAFQPSDATRFFGRDELIATLVDRLSTERVLVVGGPSGSGKSSVVRAGLIPAIGSGALAGSERWPVALFTPRANPNAELSFQLTKVSQATSQRRSGTEPITDRSSDRERLVAETVTDATGGLLLVIDQFEELFTHNASSEREDFIATLANLADPTDSRVRIVIVVRADFYAACAAYPWLADRISRNQVLVGPMTRSELRMAIEEPAMVAALRLETGLIEAVLDDGGDEPGALPLVSHAMSETWRRRRGSTLTIEGYRAAGGVAGAIAQTAEALYEDFGTAEREACRRLMLRLVAPGEGTSDSRRRLAVDGPEFDEDAVTKTVVEAMVEARLLMVDRNAIEIAHEALLRTWPRLRRWIEEGRDDLRMRQRINHAAGEWRMQDRDADLLYRGTPLQSALEWAAEHGEVLDAEDREFLDASESAFRQAEAAAHEADLRSRRRTRIAVAVLAGLAAIAGVASIVAFSALDQATERFSESIATQAAAFVGEDPRLAAALAVEAIERGSARSLDARIALVDSSRTLETALFAPVGTPALVQDALSVAIRSDGEVAVTGDRDGSIQLWDSKGEAYGLPVPGHDDAIKAISFTPDGTTLLTGSDDGTIRIWDVSDPARIPPSEPFGDTEAWVWDIDVSADGAVLASASEDGRVLLWDIASRRQIGAPVIDGMLDALSVEFSPDGGLLLAGNGRGEITGWSLPDRAVVIDTFNAHASDLWEIEFDPTGTSFATASSDQTVRTWDTATAEFIGEPFTGAATNVQAVQMLDGGLVVAGDEAGQLWTGTLDGTMRQVASSPHRGQIERSAVAGDVLVTLGADRRLQRWVEAGEPTGIDLDGFAAGAFAVAASSDGEKIAIGDGEGTVAIHSSATGERLAGPVPVHTGRVWALAFNDDGTQLVSGGEDGAIVTLDGTSAQPVATVVSSGPEVQSLLFDGDSLVVGDVSGMVTLYRDGERIDAVAQGLGRVTAMDISPSGVLAVANSVGHVSLWNVETGTSQMAPMRADDNTIWDVAWSPDASLLATASADEIVQLWDAETLDHVATLSGHDGGAHAVVFLPDGVTIAAADGTGRVLLWDVELARPIGGSLTGHTSEVWRMEAIPGTTRFVTSSEDGTVRVWTVLDLAAACDRAAGAFDAGHQRRVLGEGEEPLGCEAAS